MSFTKGPWKYEPSTKTIRSKKENYWLATMDSWDGAVDHEANAKLIAAAPDLLRALEDCQQALANAIFNGIPPSSASLIAWKYAEDVARATIAKAKGETP